MKKISYLIITLIAGSIFLLGCEDPGLRPNGIFKIRVHNNSETATHFYFEEGGINPSNKMQPHTNTVFQFNLPLKADAKTPYMEKDYEELLVIVYAGRNGNTIATTSVVVNGFKKDYFHIYFKGDGFTADQY